MAVKLRLKRMGAKQKPFYRIVVADSKRSRDGKFIEIVGTYDPLLDKDKVFLEEDKIMNWLQNGAKPTTTVRNILSDAGIWSKYKENKSNKKTKESGE